MFSFTRIAFIFGLVITVVKCQETNPCSLRQDDELVNDFSSCRSYFRCRNQQSTTENCNVGYIFSPEIPGCTRCYACPDDGSFAAIPMPQSCTQYVLCVNGEAIYRECPPGTHWNERVLNCDLIESAGCQEIPTPPPTTVASTSGPPTVPTVSTPKPNQ